MITLVACSGDDDEASAPVPTAQRFVTEEDAPGSKPDPDETRQTIVDFDEFMAALNELAIDPGDDEMTTVFQEGSFKGAGVDTRFYGETHTPGVSPHVVSSFIELESEDGATSALDWLEADSKKPCPMSCAVQISEFDVDDIRGCARRPPPHNGRGHREGRDRRPTPHRQTTGWDSPTVPSFTPWTCLGRRGLYLRSRLWKSRSAYHDRLTGS